MSTAPATPPSILSPRHSVSVRMIESIKEHMKDQQVSRADIVASTHLTKRSLEKKLNHRSRLMVLDIFAITRVLNLDPSIVFAAADSHPVPTSR